MQIEFPFLPPNCNHGYLRPSGGGKWFMAKEAKEFKEQIAWIVKKYKPLEGDLKVTAEFTFPDKRRRDAQNLEKLLWDSLQGYCYHDDKQIADRRVIRIYGDKSHTKVTVEKISEDK